MASILLVNPKDRKEPPIMAGKKKAARSPAQEAATRRMLAANRKARKAKAAAAAAPRPAPKKAAAKKPRKSAGARGVIRKGQWPITSDKEATRAGRALRHRRPNPTGILSDFKQAFVPSAIGGGGALLLDVALGILPLPAQMKVGPMAPIVRIGGAVALGAVAGMVVSRRTANQIAAGALTVTLYDLAKDFIVKTMPGKIPGLGAYGVDAGMGAYGIDGGMGAPSIPYDSDDQVGDYEDMGYVDSGMVVGDLMPDGSVGGWETGVYR